MSTEAHTGQLVPDILSCRASEAVVPAGSSQPHLSWVKVSQPLSIIFTDKIKLGLTHNLTLPSVSKVYRLHDFGVSIRFGHLFLVICFTFFG